MRHQKLQRTIIVILLGAVVTAAGCYRKGPEQRAQAIVNNIAEKLNLNDSQKAKLNAMKDEFMAKGPAMKKTREETFDQLITMMRSPVVDQGTLKALEDRNRTQADDLVGFIFTKYVEFHDMLTPEQREKAAKEMERWREQYREANQGERGGK